MNDETATTIYTGDTQAISTNIETSNYDVLPSLSQVIEDWFYTSKSDSAKTRKARRETFTRKTIGKKDAAQALPKEQVSAGLASINRNTPEGLRDYALLSIAVTT